jgi:hypothetical protein
VCEAPQFDHSVLSSCATDALLVDCGGGELYMYIGEDADDDTRACAKAAAEAYRCVLFSLPCVATRAAAHRWHRKPTGTHFKTLL